jgi:hypothetical protein
LKRAIFQLLKYRIPNFQENISFSNFLTSVPGVLVNISLEIITHINIVLFTKNQNDIQMEESFQTFDFYIFKQNYLG